jgi:hypothetical protein
VKKNLSSWRLAVSAAVVFGVSILLTLFSFWQTGLAVREVRTGQFKAAQLHASLALPWVQISSTVSLHLIPDLEFWRISLETIHQLPVQIETAHIFVQKSLSGDEVAKTHSAQLQQDVSQVRGTVQNLIQLWNRSWLLKHVSSPKIKSTLDTLQLYFPDLDKSAQILLTGNHKYIVLLQNSEELRPTGGFMGSYAKIELSDGVVSTFKIYDIYEPDGQFVGYIEAPHGLKEYLSSGNGMRLPDANWSPDFPTAAQNIIQLLANSKEPGVDGIIALNVEVIQHALDILGPIQVPDFQQVVTSENLPDLARADRSNFFPGSQQKKQFLQALLTQIKIQTQQLTPNQLKNIGVHLLSDVQANNIQFYSTQSELQQLFTTYHIDGAITTYPEQNSSYFYFFPVEANVGINKVNRHVKRNISITGPTQAPQRIQLQIINDDPSLDYINYQRLLFSPTVTVEEIQINDKPITKWDYALITSKSGTKYQEFGFLASAAHQSRTFIQIKLRTDGPVQKLHLQKQSGVNNTPYFIQLGNFQHSGEISTDLTFDL